MAGDRIVLLGTRGGPRITAGGSWPTSSVFEVRGRPYLIDAGLGVTRQFVEAGYKLDDIHTIAITHHHSDHNLELGPLLHTIWTSSRKRVIKVYAPAGISQVIEGFLLSNAYDIGVRIADEKQADIADMIESNVYGEGRVFADDLVEVDALRVVHPPVEECFALRFRTAGKSAVFSSDTCYFPPLAEFAKDADVLVHEAMHREGAEKMCARLSTIKPDLLKHMTAGHTSAQDAGRIAAQAGVKHLALNHFTPSDEPGITPEHFRSAVRETWDGPLTIGSDLAVIPL
ncbi:MAG: MBL fold metallo-hydrolase [Albidovulum sp.]|nr:MBL fold metallo-hydrolase [Albidovulum sp.]